MGSVRSHNLLPCHGAHASRSRADYPDHVIPFVDRGDRTDLAKSRVVVWVVVAAVPDCAAVILPLAFAGIPAVPRRYVGIRSEEHTSELQSLRHLVCRLLLE